LTKRTFLSVLLGLLILAAGTTTSGTTDNPATAAVQAKAKSSLAPYASDRVIVKFKAGVEVNLGLQKVKQFHLIKASVFKVPTGETAEAFVARLSADPNVEYAELVFRQWADVLPNDTRFSELWGLHNTGQNGGKVDADIDMPEAWDLTTGGNDIVVAVIDTGVDYTHPDLAINMWENNGEIAGDGLDNDGNGYVDDVYGINVITGSGDPMDDFATIYHGTHCAGTIGAVGNNSAGVTGISWKTKIMALKFLGSDGSGWTDDAITCIQYAVDNGAHILSNSWGGEFYEKSLYDAIEVARDAGILFIAAAGNDGTNNDKYPHYPACYNNENVIAVAATDRNDLLADYSSWGSNYGPKSVDVAAPGVDILSCKAGNDYQLLSGTSMATPHVAGVAALLKSSNPAWTWDEVKARVLGGVEPLPGLSGKVLTGGRINAYNSLVYVPVTLVVTSPSASSTWYRKAAYEIAWKTSGSQNPDVKIELYRGTTKVKTISFKTPNDGSYAWTIPGDLAPAANYRIHIRTVDNLLSDTSDDFAVAKPSIKITAPVAGTKWARKTTQTITWTVNGTMDASVKIQLFRGTTLVQTITATTPNSGSYSWDIPGFLAIGSNYKIKIKTADNAVSAKSGLFTIS
jgi:subtilisin family serine protease